MPFRKHFFLLWINVCHKSGNKMVKLFLIYFSFLRESYVFVFISEPLPPLRTPRTFSSFRAGPSVRGLCWSSRGTPVPRLLPEGLRLVGILRVSVGNLIELNIQSTSSFATLPAFISYAERCHDSYVKKREEMNMPFRKHLPRTLLGTMCQKMGNNCHCYIAFLKLSFSLINFKEHLPTKSRLRFVSLDFSSLLIRGLTTNRSLRVPTPTSQSLHSAILTLQQGKYSTFYTREFSL